MAAAMAEASRSPDIDTRPERSRTLRWAGRLGAPATALTVYAVLPTGPGALTPEGRATAAIGVLMAVLWMTEAMPLPATSLLPIALLPLAGVMPIEAATAPYANKVIFLFMGGFMLALAMQRWELHKRIALATLLLVGTKPAQLVGGFMLATAVLSMWVSNTATTVMMLPIGVSVVALVEERLPTSGRRPAGTTAFATSLLLGIAYAASIGSVGTPIGTPPNLLLKGFVQETYGIEIAFGQWMAVGLPLVAVFLPAAWLLLTRVLYPTDIEDIPGGREMIRAELRRLGPPSRGEWTVFAVFTATALAWVIREPLTGWAWLVERVPGITALDDAGIAIIAALLLFALPVDRKRGIFVLDWDSAKRLPWGVLLLFGGGLSLAGAVQHSGVDIWIGANAEVLGGLPSLLLVAVVAGVVILLTELTSNTATAATFLPVLGGVALGVGVDPLLLVIPAALAATFAFMLPVATPPNAIVFGSGQVTIGQMVRAGVVLNLIGVILATLVAFTLAAWVFGIDLTPAST